MLKASELGNSLSKQQYDAVLPGLRAALLNAQFRLKDAGLSVIVLVNGADGSGKSETVNALHEWLDTRYLVSEAYGEPSEEERERPELWRYWMWLPPAGRIGLFSGSWYTRPILDRVKGRLSERELLTDTARINAFERTLADEGSVIIKLWFHVSKRDQKRRLKKLESNEATAFRVTKRDWKHHNLYDDFVEVTEQVLVATNSGFAPWQVIEGADDQFRNVAAARTLIEGIERRLSEPRPAPAVSPPPQVEDPETLLDRLELSLALGKDEYAQRISSLQARINALSLKLQRKRRSAILVFEGPDAGGKGGAIRRLTWALDARSYKVIPIAAPNEEERAHHYLWRFWRQLPRRGRFTIFDRSWYGRVLVERVEGFATPEQWQRAYQEINDFERELTQDGVILVKFWLHISQDEQLRRFQEREQNPVKNYKITSEDYRNRDKANAYESAAADMITRCSPPSAPFVLVEANDKRYARVKVLESVCERLDQEL